MEIKSIERNDDLQGFIVTVSYTKIVQVQFELNTNQLDADYNTHYPIIDKANEYGLDLTYAEAEDFELWLLEQWATRDTEIRNYADELDANLA